MNNKTATKYRIIFYICIIATIACLLIGFCTLHTVRLGDCYYRKNDVALYIYRYNQLPPNFVTKSQSTNLNANEKMQYNIGGDTYQNREGRLPDGKSYVECDIYTGNSNIDDRGEKRIVFAIDGSCVYYTPNHYTTFTKITIGKINGLSYTLFGFSVVLLVGQLVFAIRITKSRNKNRFNALEQWVVALEVTVVVMILIAFSPILLVLWLVDCLRQRKFARHPELDM